jgi:uncharacterized lipoprotein YddW (UPF0748 family)
MANDSIYQHIIGASEPKLPVHAWASIMRLWMIDDITGATAQARLEQTVQQDPAWSSWTLDAAQQTQLTDIRTQYDSGNPTDKNEYLHRFESVAVLLEDETMTETEAKSLLGVP